MKPVSGQLFAFENRDRPRLAHQRCSAKDLGVDESWLRDAIFNAPELVIGPCRAAGLTEDEWYPWQCEFKVDVGKIDVMLLSSQGRVAIVETKLATNPELRRRVLAQALDYLTHLAERLDDAMPDIPIDENGDPVADAEDIRESAAQGDMLVIIASDDVDTRAAKLSRSLLSDHLVKQWDLALVDLALYRPPPHAPGSYLVVPHLCNVIESEPRQVVRVIVEGETPSARVQVERVSGDETSPARQKWDEKRFFERLQAKDVPQEIRTLASQLRELARRLPQSVTLAWGTGRRGSMIVKRAGNALIEIHGTGEVRLRVKRFTAALGEDIGRDYRRAVEELLPGAGGKRYVSPAEAANAATALYDLIRRAIEQAERSGTEGSTAASGHVEG